MRHHGPLAAEERQVAGQPPRAVRSSELVTLGFMRMDRAMKYDRVVLADSHLNLLSGVHSLLDALFESVLMVADERSMMEALAKFEPSLVVVDLSLPDSGQANIAMRLHRSHPQVPFIVLSVHDDPSVVTEVQNAGAAGFVLKRRVATDLVPAVHQVLRGGVFVSPAAQHLDRRWEKRHA
jgi:DNA-binding NarL/FixJ family response regulator